MYRYPADQCLEPCCEPERHTHEHCVACGKPLFAEGGGGDDGRKIAGYTDAVRCDSCSSLACSDPACSGRVDDGTHHCTPCREDDARFDRLACSVLADLRELRALCAAETDQRKLLAVWPLADQIAGEGTYFYVDVKHRAQKIA